MEKALGVEEVRLTKKYGLAGFAFFPYPRGRSGALSRAVTRGSAAQVEWESRFKAFAKDYPDLAAEFHRVIGRHLPEGWDAELPSFTSADGPMATRVASGKMIEILGSSSAGDDVVGRLGPSTIRI